MARLFKKTYRKPIPPDAERRTRNGRAEVRIGRKWWPVDPGQPDKAILERTKWYVEFTDERGERRQVPAFTDKSASESRMRELVARAERIKAGLPVELSENRSKSLTDALVDHVGELQRTGRSVKHCRSVHNRLSYLFKRCDICETCRCCKNCNKRGKCDACRECPCGWATLADIDAAQLERFLKTLADGERSSRTQNSYLGYLNTFCRWCQRRGLLAANPAATVARAKSRKKRPRRAYTEAEFRKMVETARGLDPLRRLVYLVAGLAGWRYSELGRLRKHHACFDGGRGSWHIPADMTKEGRPVVLPMMPELADALRPHWDALPSETSPLFETVPPISTLNKDLRRAGIPKMDPTGRSADWHSFRLTFCTILARRVPIQVVRKLMRHADIRMTANVYLDLGIEDLADAMDDLPRIFADT